MKHLNYTQIAVVSASTAEEFQSLFNSKMKELSSHSETSYEFNHNQGFCAYITYTEHEKLIESISDEYRSIGLIYKCWQCPHMEEVADKRVKKCKCKHAPAGFTKKNDSACDIFYEQLKADMITPREVQYDN